MHVILGGLKSGGLMTGGLMSCGLMSGGLKSYDHLPHITLEWPVTDQTESGNNSYPDPCTNTPRFYIISQIRAL